MAAKFTETDLPGVILIEPDTFPDSRGYFYETYHIEKYQNGGLAKPFVQDNFSNSKKNVLRGLHYQITRPQAKLVSCLRGEIFDVAVDIRKDSKTFGKWTGVQLTGENKHQLFVPEGFAHGFCVLSEDADVHYKCTDIYVQEYDRGLNWEDPQFAISWPVAKPILSEKDSVLSKLSEVDSSDLP